MFMVYVIIIKKIHVLYFIIIKKNSQNVELHVASVVPVHPHVRMILGPHTSLPAKRLQASSI